jgi:hypothetical protein
MGVTFNYIDESERLFLEDSYLQSSLSTLWTSNGTLSADPVVYQDSDFGSLYLSPSALENYVKYNYWATPATDIPSQYAISPTIDENDFIESFIWVRPSVNCTIYIKTVLTKVTYDPTSQQYELSTDPADVITGVEGVHEIALGVLDSERWHLLRAVPTRLGETGNYSVSLQIRVVFSTTTNAHLNISRPTIHTSYGVFKNKFMQFVAQFMPEIFITQDTADFATSEPTFPMIRFIDSITTNANDIQVQSEAFTYIDRSTGFDETVPEAFSTLVDPNYCDGATLLWLAQFRGRQILVTYQPSTEGASWVRFTLDDAVSGVLDDIAVLGSNASDIGLPDGVDAYARWQVQTGYYGHNAGTIEAMVSAIQRLLTGAGVVNYTVSANAIHFTTSWTETYGSVIGDIGSSSELLLQIVEPARPLGMIVTHTLTA